MDEPLSAAELEAEGATALPSKEVMSLLDVNANVDLGLDLVAPVDLAAAANLNVAAPIEASAAANVLSPDAHAVGLASQHAVLDQGITGHADATAPQSAQVTQGATDGGTTQTAGDTGTDGPTGGGTTSGGVDSLLNGGSLLDANLNVHANADLAAPVDGAVAVNGNVAAPIDAAVGANIGSEGATAQALAPQDVQIHQTLDADADAVAQQTASVQQ